MTVVLSVLLSIAWLAIQFFIGGTRLIYSLPAYALLAVAAILSLACSRGKRVPPDPFCIAATLLLGGWVLIRAWRSPVEYLALSDFLMMIGCLMTYFITAFYLTEIRSQTILIGTLWFITAAELWVALIQFSKDPNFMLFGLIRPTIMRPSGLYISPNNFAGFLVTVAALSLSLGVWSRWRVPVKIVAFYLAGCCLLGVAISGSRGGYFATIGSLLCLAIGSVLTVRAVDPRKFVPAALGSLAGVAAVVGIAAFLMFHSYYLTRRMQTMVAKDNRIYNWEAAIDHIRLSPWTGTGAGTHLIYGRLFRRPEIQEDPVHAHCDYLELLAEYGIAGAVCMALFLAAHIRNGLRSLSQIAEQRLIPSGLNKSNSYAIQLGALCAIGGLAIHSVVDFDMHIPGNALVFAFIFGILANPGLDRRIGFSDRYLIPWTKVIAPALGVFILWFGIPLIPSEYCAEMARRSLRNHDFVDCIKFARRGIGESAPTFVNSPAPGAVTAAGQDLDFLDRSLKILGPNPRNPDLYFYLGEANRGLAASMKGRFLRDLVLGRAVSAFQTGLSIFPEDESMLIRYAQALDQLRRFDDAEVVYQKVINWDPNLATLYGYYSDHFTAAGNQEQAEAMARKQSDFKPVEVDTGGALGDFRLR